MTGLSLRISSLVLMAMAVSVLLSTAIGLGLWSTFREHRDAMARERFATEIVTSAFQLTSLTRNYLLYRGDRAKSQWASRHDALGGLLEWPGFEVAGMERALALLRRDHSTAERLFERIAESPENIQVPGGHGSTASPRQERLANTLLAVAQSMVSQATLLSGSSRLALDASGWRIKWLTSGLITFLTGLLLCLWLGLTRRVIAPIRELAKGIERFGRGDLDHRLAPRHADEIGEIATKFNEMAARLRETLVSRDQLESRIEGRTRKLAVANKRLRYELDAREKAEEAAAAAETRYRDIVENAVEGMAETTPEGGLISVNPAFARMLGYDSPEEILTSINDIGTQVYTDPQRRREIHTLIQSSSEVTAIESEYRRKDGGTVWLSENARAVRDREGRISRYEAFMQDITVRKLAEQAAAEAETRYRDIIESAVEGMVQATPEGRFIAVNPAFARMLGYDSPEDLMNRAMKIGTQVYVDPQKRRELRAIVEQTGEATSFESACRRKDGGIVWLSENTRAVRDRSGKSLRYESFVQDITVRKQAELALRSSEEQFRKVFDASPAMIAINEIGSGHYVDANEAYLDTMGYSRDELIGKSVYDLGIWANPEERDRLIEQMGKHGHIRDFAMQARTKSGALLDFVMSASPVILQEQERLLIFVEDVTERKHAENALRVSEARFRAVVDNVPVAVYLKDLEGHYLLHNRIYEEWYGIGPDEIRSRTVDEFFPAEMAEAFIAQDKRLLKSGTIDSMEIDVVHKDGGIRPTIMIKFPVLDPDGKIAAIGGINIDITERKQAEEALHAAQDALLRKERLAALGQLTATVAHELRNPLGAVATSAHVLRRK